MEFEAQTAMQKERNMKGTHAVEVSEDIADEDVGQAIAMLGRPKMQKGEIGITEATHGVKGTLEVERVQNGKVPCVHVRMEQGMCKGCRVGVKGLLQEAMDHVQCLNGEMHGRDMCIGKDRMRQVARG